MNSRSKNIVCLSVLVVAQLVSSMVFAKGDALAELKANYVRPKEIPHPAENPFTPERDELGKMLFFEPRISSSKIISCATCHNPSMGWADGLPKGLGIEHKAVARKTPTVYNLAWAPRLPWDGRVTSLEAISKIPIHSPKIMATTVDNVVEVLKTIPEYPRLFEKAYPGEGLTADNVLKALGTYQRGLVSPKTSFDAWIEGKEDAISDSAKRGFAVFNGKARCSQCHSGWAFTDYSFHDIGVAGDDKGRGAHLALPTMQFAFKTPGLHDIAVRAPYMHDGSEKTLEEVVEFYNRGGKANRPDSRSKLIGPLKLSTKEKRDLVEFLNTLTSTEKSYSVPVLPPPGKL